MVGTLAYWTIVAGLFGGGAAAFTDCFSAISARAARARPHGFATPPPVGLDHDQTWSGAPYPIVQFRSDAGLRNEVGLLSDGTVSDMIWARPAVTVLGIDCPPVIGSAAAIQPHARARLNLRVPPARMRSTLDPGIGWHWHRCARRPMWTSC